MRGEDTRSFILFLILSKVGFWIKLNPNEERINLHLLNSSSNLEDKVLKDKWDITNFTRNKEDNSN